MNQTLNIPLKLMKRYRKDKTSWDCFIFASCMKMMFGSSSFRPDVKTVRKLFGVSYYKAERLINQAKSNTDLFVYHEKTNTLIARSFTRGKLEKRECVSERNGNKYTAYMAFCYKFKFETAKSYSHFKIAQEFKNVLIRQSIKARAERNNLNWVGNNKPRYNSCSNRSVALTTAKLGTIAGCHYSTASRRIKKMNASNIVNTIKCYAIVADRTTNEILTSDERLLSSNLFPSGNYIVARDANEYVINSTCNDEFVNVIFNHRSRRKNNVSLNRKMRKNENRADYINETVLGAILG